MDQMANLSKDAQAALYFCGFNAAGIYVSAGHSALQVLETVSEYQELAGLPYYAGLLEGLRSAWGH